MQGSRFFNRICIHKSLWLNRYQKLDKAPFISYPDLERFVEKVYGSKNDAKNSYTTRVGEHIPSGFSMSKISSFKSIKGEDGVCRVLVVWKSFVKF